MKHKIISVIVSYLIFVLLAAHSDAKDWDEIVLLKSTCNDVKRILNVDFCKAPFSTYRLKDETVTIFYAESPCGKEPVNKNTPANVVTSLSLSFHNPKPFSEISHGKVKFKKLYTDFKGEIQYYNDDEGVNYHTVDGMLNSISYYPSQQERIKRCGQ